MRDVQSVKIFDSIQNLIEYSARSPLFKPHFIRHNSEKLSLFCILDHEIDKLSCFDYLVQVSNVGMSHFFHDFNFSFDSNRILFLLNGVFVDNFDCDFLFCRDMDCLFNFSEGTPPNCFAQLVISDYDRFSNFFCYVLDCLDSHFICKCCILHVFMR